MLSTVVYASLAFISVCFLSDWLISLQDGPGEPPRARSKIPLIGHLLGLIKSGTAYFTQVSAQQRTEIYTLGIFHFKIYVINSRRLIPLVQRNSKTLSFSPFLQVGAKVFAGSSNYTVDLFANPAFLRDHDKATRQSLAPGPQLDSMNLRATNSLKRSLDELLSRSPAKNTIRIRLYNWSTHTITLAATNGVYGASNPYLNKRIEKAYWTWNAGIPTLVAGLGVFARKALRGRQDVINSHKKYLGGDYEDASEVLKEQVRVLSAYGVPADDIARQRASFDIALLSNTAPTAFWTIFNIFSRPALLQELRAELEDNAVLSSRVQNQGNSEFELDIVAIKTKCPLLLSVFQETQRTLTIHANIRKVLEDTTLEGYRLQKGSYVQIPNAPIHNNTEFWGADAAAFNPRRFVKNEETVLASSIPSYAFLAFGTAPHLCPARQFASTEILVMVALLALRVEIEPLGGKWERPDPKYGEFVTVLPPKRDIDVNIRSRDGWDGNWSLKIGESTSRIQLASG